MPAKTLVVINPQSAGGATGRRWAEIEPQVRATLGELEVQRTLGRRDAERIARDAVRAGVQRLVVAGGDGTTSEVVSGLLAAGVANDAQVGVLPMGTGRDLPRTLGVPSDMSAAIEVLGRGETRRVDALRVRYRDRNGAERTVHAINVTGFGLSGLTVELVTRAPRFLGGSFAFLLGALGSIARFRPVRVRMEADGQPVLDEEVVLVAAANGRYFGGGMQIAPDASIDDGVIDLVIVRAVSKAGLVRALPSLYRGTHVAHPAVTVQRVTKVFAESAAASDEPVFIDVDGEGLGTLPLEVELLPRAVTFFGVAPGGSGHARQP